jgi:hypothetical protein
MAHNAQDAPETLLQHLNHSGPGAPASGSLFRPAPGANLRGTAIRGRRQPERAAAAITPLGLLAGLILFAAFGSWRADPAAALAVRR